MPTTDDLMSMWNASGLKQKIIFTFLMIAVWRFGVQMPLYGINNQVFSNIAQGNNIIGFLDLFSGGALGKSFNTCFRYWTVHHIINYYPACICCNSGIGKTSERRGRSRKKKIVSIYKNIYCSIGNFPIIYFYVVLASPSRCNNAAG